MGETKAETTQTSLAAMPALREVPEDVALAVEASDRTVTPAQVRVLKATICAKLSIEQLQLYLTICARKHVDPFSEAYAFPQKDGGLAFGLRIDGMQALAARTGQLRSVSVETLTHENPDKTKSLVGARCIIEREGLKTPVVEEAYMAEYAHAGLGWDTYPETMIRKVARAKCLRVAFADALSGIYEPAEIRKDEDGTGRD
jgi:hypothetical protein